MWKEYSTSYIKNNKSSSISIMISVFIATAFISAFCSIFYNIWTDGIVRGTLGNENGVSRLFIFSIVILSGTCMVLTMIIYNAFGITMNSRMHQLGILQSIGATPNQIQTALLYEASALSILPALLGLAAGIIIDYCLIRLSNVIGNLDGRQNAVFAYSTAVMAVTMGLSFITVFLASWRAAWKISKVTPLEAIRRGEETGVSKVKKFRIISSLFGIEGELARKSLFARRRAFRTTEISLTLSFIIFSVFLNFFVLSDMSTKQSYFERYKNAWDLMITLESEKDGRQLLDRIKELNKVKECTAYQISKEYSTWISDEMLSQELKTMGGPLAFGDTGIVKEEGGYRIKTPIIVLDDDSFQAYCNGLGIDISSFSGAYAVTINRIWDKIHSDFRQRQYLPFIKEQTDNLLSLNADNSQEEYQLKMSAYTNKLPNLREEYSYFALIQIMSETSYKEMEGIKINDAVSYRILANSEEYISGIQKEAEYILEDGAYKYTIENRKTEEEYNTAVRSGANIILGIICSMLAIIGVANVFANTIGSAYLRKKEFARYMSVGMEPGSIKKILVMEALIIGLKPVLIGIPVNMLFVIFAVYAKYGEFLKIMPIMPILAMEIIILTSISLAYYISGRKLCGINMAEVLKDDTLL